MADCEDCGVRIHLENEGIMVSTDGNHYICPECAPKYEHVFPTRVWNADRGCWEAAA